MAEAQSIESIILPVSENKNLGVWKSDDGGDIFPFYLSKKRLEEIATFKPRPSDVFIATHPKSGTTWMQTIVHVLMTHKQVEEQLDGLQPFLELPIVGSVEEGEKLPIAPFFYTLSFLENLANPRVFKTHLPFKFIPYTPDCKYIYTFRNPKDVVVSDFHYAKGMKFTSYKGTFEEYLGLFMRGELSHGFWYDHVLGWWTNRGRPNVLLISYESLILEFKGTVTKIADFLGLKITEEIFQLVLEYTKFDSVKINKFVNKSIIPWNPDSPAFIRKGIIGDWKNHFTQKQNKEFEAWYITPLQDSGLIEELVFQNPAD